MILVSRKIFSTCVISILITGSLFVFVQSSKGYDDQTTHPGLTDEIVDFYNLSFDDKLTVEEKELIIQGAKDEDTPPRWINHFYDPVNRVGWSGKNTGIWPTMLVQIFSDSTLSSRDPVSSLFWLHAQEYQAGYGQYKGNRTWERAIYEAVNGNKEEAYYTLGFILHLIEDVTVPDHTRNDTHAHELRFVTGDYGSPYEEFSKQFTRSNLDIAKELKKNGDQPVTKSSIDEYLMSLAEYSNNNFFSKDTINGSDYEFPKIYEDKCDSNFCYGEDEYKKSFPILHVDENWSFQKFDFIRVYYLPTKDNNNSSVLQSYFSRLSRQAVLNGAGVINLFEQEVAKAEKEKLQALPKESSSVFSIIGSFFQAKNFLVDVLDTVSNTLSSAYDSVKTTVNKIGTSVAIFANNTLNFISDSISTINNTLSSAYNSAKATISNIVTIDISRNIGDFPTNQTASLLEAVNNKVAVVEGPVYVNNSIQGEALDVGSSNNLPLETAPVPTTNTIQSQALDSANQTLVAQMPMPLVFTGGAMPIVAAPAYVAPQPQAPQQTQTTQTVQNDQTTQTTEETSQDIEQATTTPDVIVDVTSTTTPDITTDVTSTTTPEIIVETATSTSAFSDLNNNNIADSEEVEVLVDSNNILLAGEYHFNNLTIASSSTLTLQGDPTSTSIFKGVKIVAHNITVEAGSSISADYQGYKINGPGSPSAPAYLAGASYGGIGTGGGVPSYGDALTPTELGSNGGVCCGNYQGGGGAMHFIVSGTFLNNGIVSANGSGSSSGGSIYGVVGTLAGSGIFQANGGAHSVSSVYHGRAGGGRTALYYRTSSFSGVSTALGGCSSLGMGYAYECAGNGTAGLFDTKNNDLYVSSSWRFQANDAPFILNRVVVKNGAHVTVEDGVNLSANELSIEGASSFSIMGSSVISIPAISVHDNSTLTFSGTETLTINTLSVTGTSTISVLQGSPLRLHVQNITISPDSKISLDSKGYSGGMGPGSPIEFYDGASHGGVGYSNSATSTYGSITEPIEMGSGGNGHYSYAQGGGALKIVADGTFVLDGVVSVRGGITASGGSIYIIARNLTGSGQLVADGGSLYWQGQYIGMGGGGRIAVTADQYAFTGSMSALGGCAQFDGWTMSCAGNGTIVNSNELTLEEETQDPPAEEVPPPDIVPPNPVDDTGDTATSTAPVIEDADTAPPFIASYTLNGNENTIEMTVASSSLVTLVLSANENVDWVSLKIEHSDDAGIYKVFYSGAECVDGTTQCTKVWDNSLSKGDLIAGTYRIKVHLRDIAGNDFTGYLEPYVIIITDNPLQNEGEVPVLEVLDPVL